MSRVLDLFNVICTYKYHRWKNQQKVFYATFVLKIPFTSLWFLESDFFNNYFETAYVLYVPSFIWVNAKTKTNVKPLCFSTKEFISSGSQGKKSGSKHEYISPPPPVVLSNTLNLQLSKLEIYPLTEQYDGFHTLPLGFLFKYFFQENKFNNQKCKLKKCSYVFFSQ